MEEFGNIGALDEGGLEQAQYLLERMLELAERSADRECTDRRRAVLQKGFSFLRAEVLEILDKSDREDK